MKNFIFIIVICFTSILFNCKEEKSLVTPTKSNQMQEVMAIHDEIMPKMSSISTLVATLKAKLDSGEGTAEHKKAMEDLQNAHEAMMVWMREFGDNFNSEEILEGKPLNTEKQTLLNLEEKKIEIVKDKINASIAAAKTLLNKS